MITLRGRIAPASISHAALALALTLPAMPAWAQAPETQTATDPAPAQDAASATAAVNNASGGVEEIVVTAQFREQNLQETPLAITAMSGAMLEARSQTNVSQIANDAPSVTLKPQGAAYGPSLAASIRGIGQYDFNPALEPGVGVYVDDVYYATLTGSIFDLLDLDRVEILRGPQGTLSGKNSIGGAIKLYSKKPTGDNSGYLSATYGSRDRIDLRGSIDFAVTDNLYARLSGVSKKQDGYIKRIDYGCANPDSGIPAQLSANVANGCVAGRESEVDYNALRGQLRWEASDAIEVNVIGDYTIDDRTSTGSVLTYADYTGAGDINPFADQTIRYDNRFICGKYCNYSTYIANADPSSTPPRDQRIGNGRTRFEGWGVSGKIDWKLTDDLALESISAYRAYNTQISNDDDFSPLAHSFGRGDLRFHSFSQELRLNGSVADDRLEYTLGGFYMDQKSTYATFQELRYATPTGTMFQGNDPVNADTKALFAHATFHATDQLSLTGGLRYTDEHKDYTFTRLLPNGQPQSAVNGVTGIYNKKRVDYRANVQYQWTDELMTYAQFSTGFKGGGISPRPFFPEQVQPFNPETLKSYEIGLKSDLFDRRVRFNVAGFYGDYQDIQLGLNYCPQFGPAASRPCALQTNAGSATLYGFEVETSVRPIDGFMIDAALSYIDFDYKSGSLQESSGITPDMVSPYTPKWKWSIGAQYEIPADALDGTITPRFDMAFQDDLYTNAVNGPVNKINDYIVANARITYRNEANDWELSAEVTNLFDKYYYLTSFDLTRAGAGVVSNQPGRPREWAVTIKKKF